MNDLRWRQERAEGASPGRPLDDLDELYRRTKAAQAHAARHGFTGTAAALAEIAALLAQQPGLSPKVVREVAGWEAAGLEAGAGAPAPGGGRPALH